MHIRARTLVSALALLGAGTAHADKVDRSMVVLDFAAQSPQDGPRAQAATALVTALLQKHPGAHLVTSSDVRSVLGVEKQKQLLGCSDDGCIAEIGGALGARYILSGRVAKLGDKFLLTGALLDARTARSVDRFAQSFDGDDALAAAADQVAGEVATAAGLAEVPPPPGSARGFNLDLKLGNAIPQLTSGERLDALNLRFDFELGYFVTQHVSPFLGASLLIATGAHDTLSFLPVTLGAKYYFRPESMWQPYLGGGIGLGFLFGAVDPAADNTGTSFSVLGIGGVAFIPWRHVGFNAELSVNLSGVDVSGSGVLLSYNFDFGVLFLF